MRVTLEQFLVRLFYGPQNRYQHVGGNEVKGDSHKIVSFQKLALVTLSLPLCGFIFCVLWSILYNFVDSTSTHCGVPNYLPSVSASIGSYSPQKYVWRLTVALHSAPRYLVSIAYYKLFHASNFLLVLNCAEISSLLGLSIISSTENFGKYLHVHNCLSWSSGSKICFIFVVIHANCFLLFITSSFVGSIVHLLQENLWSRFKLRTFGVNTVAWVLALFFYARHNQYCEIGVYSLFAASEYVFVISNMIFHFQAFFDFAEVHFCASNKMVNINSKFSVW